MNLEALQRAELVSPPYITTKQGAAHDPPAAAVSNLDRPEHANSLWRGSTLPVPQRAADFSSSLRHWHNSVAKDLFQQLATELFR